MDEPAWDACAQSQWFFFQTACTCSQLQLRGLAWRSWKRFLWPGKSQQQIFLLSFQASLQVVPAEPINLRNLNNWQQKLVAEPFWIVLFNTARLFEHWWCLVVPYLKLFLSSSPSSTLAQQLTREMLPHLFLYCLYGVFSFPQRKELVLIYLFATPRESSSNLE